jgi:hypothetical protein
MITADHAAIRERIDLATRALEAQPPEQPFTADGDWTGELLEWTSANGVSLDWLITGETQVLLRNTAQLLQNATA